jgi:hypothetical protein
MPDDELEQQESTQTAESRLKPESEMSVGKDYPITRDPPTFEYDPSRAGLDQQGLGEGGYG